MPRLPNAWFPESVPDILGVARTFRKVLVCTRSFIENVALGIIQLWLNAGLFVVVPQTLASVQVRVCVVLEQADHAVQIQDSTQAGVVVPPMEIG